MISTFKHIVHFDDLVRSVRRRYQQWVGDDIGQLKGLFAGFCLARPTVDHHRMVEFETFLLAQIVASGSSAANWVSAIQSLAKNSISEIPYFFLMYELFCEKPSEEVARVKLSEAERLRFSRMDLLQFHSKSIPSPCYLSLLYSEYWGATVRLYDYDGEIVYELGVASIDDGNELICKYRGEQPRFL